MNFSAFFFLWFCANVSSLSSTSEESNQTDNQSERSVDDLMSVSRGGYLMQRPISSMHKYVDRILRYAKPPQTPWRRLGGHNPPVVMNIFFVHFDHFITSAAVL